MKTLPIFGSLLHLAPASIAMIMINDHTIYIIIYKYNIGSNYI